MLQPPLTPTEVRVLGSLAEKAVLTPDTYPLSMAGLLAACNQTTSRDPIMHVVEDAAHEAIVSLRRRSLLRAIQPAGSRVTKYEHLVAEAWELDKREVALLGVLMLRGEQTLAELFTRTARLASFSDHADVESVLDALEQRSPEPLARRVPRRPGQKEQRFAHLLGESVAQHESAHVDAASVADGPRSGDRVTALEDEVASLRSEVEALRAALDAFRQQFG